MELSHFRDIADERGICKDKATLWDKCTNNKDLVDLALSAQGMDYLAAAIGQGWGLSSDYICRRFKGFNNGRYVYHSASGYSTALYCRFKGAIVGEYTALLVIDSDIELTLAAYQICKIFAVGNCRISLHGSGRCDVLMYGDSSTIHVVSSSSVRFKKIIKRNKD